MFRRLMLLGFTLFIAATLAACSGDNDANLAGNNDQPESNNEQVPEDPNPTDDSSNAQPDPEGALFDQPDENDIIARVNGEEVKGSAYLATQQQIMMSMQQQGMDLNNSEVAAILQQQTINSVIGNRLIIQDANEKGYTPEENKINDQLEQITGQFETEEELDTALEESNLTLDELKIRLTEDLTMQMYMENETIEKEVSDEEVKEIYDNYAAQTEDIPPLEEVASQIELSIKEQDRQQQMVQIVEKLKTNSEIEILI